MGGSRHGGGYSLRTKWYDSNFWCVAAVYGLPCLLWHIKVCSVEFIYWTFAWKLAWTRLLWSVGAPTPSPPRKYAPKMSPGIVIPNNFRDLSGEKNSPNPKTTKRCICELNLITRNKIVNIQKMKKACKKIKAIHKLSGSFPRPIPKKVWFLDFHIHYLRRNSAKLKERKNRTRIFGKTVWRGLLAGAWCTILGISPFTSRVCKDVSQNWLNSLTVRWHVSARHWRNIL